MKKICIFVLLLYFVTILFGCANKEDKLANGDDSVLEPPETNSLSVDYVAFFRENICRPYLLTGIEINTEDDKHDAGEVCDICGKHTDFLREDCVDLAQAMLVTKDMASLDVYDLIGNPHFGFLKIDSDGSSVDMWFFDNCLYYYVLSDGTILQISYDDETRTVVCDVEILTGDAFMEKYPADAK